MKKPMPMNKKAMPMKDADMGMMGKGTHMMPGMPPKGMGPEMMKGKLAAKKKGK